MKRAPDTSNLWRAGTVETKAPAFGPDAWVRQHATVTIRPGESLRQIERELSREWKSECRVFVWDF